MHRKEILKKQQELVELEAKQNEWRVCTPPSQQIAWLLHSILCKAENCNWGEPLRQGEVSESALYLNISLLIISFLADSQVTNFIERLELHENI